MNKKRQIVLVYVLIVILANTLLFQNCSKLSQAENPKTTETSQNDEAQDEGQKDNEILDPIPGEPFQSIGPFETDTIKNIVIADVPKLNSSVETKSLKMNLWYPKGVTAPLPVIIHIHGGGWKSGDYNQCYNFSNGSSGTSNLCKHMSARGYAVASITYRLSSEGKFPDQLHDVKAAVRFLRKNANVIGLGKFSLDPNRIGVFGSSAGGHLALLLGTTNSKDSSLEGSLFNEFSSEVNAVVSFYGPTDFLKMDEQLAQTFETFGSHNGSNSAESLLINCLTQLKDCVDLANRANPITYIDGSEPAFFFRHGRSDNVVPYQQSEIMHAALTSKGVSSDLQILEGLGHSFNSEIGKNSIATAAFDEAVRFFDKELKSITYNPSVPNDPLPQTLSCGQGSTKQNFLGGQYEKTVVHQERTRKFRVDLPNGYNPQLSYPVIFLIHGRGGTISSFQNQTSMSEKALKKNFIVVTPEGTAAVPLPGQSANSLVFNAEFNKAAVSDKAVDDVSFLSSLIDLVVKEYSINCSRIYMAGFSMGAMMTYKMASEIPERLAGIAVVAGTIGSISSQVSMSENSFQNSFEEIAVPLIAFHSIDDNAVAFDGCLAQGSFYYPVLTKAECASQISSIGYFRDSVNKCKAETESIVSSSVTKIQYRGCQKLNASNQSEAIIDFYKLTNGSHRWPGGSDPSANRDISATDLILEFFTTER